MPVYRYNKVLKFQNQQKYAAVIWGVVVWAQTEAQTELPGKAKTSVFRGVLA